MASGSGMISVEGQPGNYSRVPGAKLGASVVLLLG